MLLGELAVGVEHEAGDLGDVVDLERPPLLEEGLLHLRPHVLDEEGDGGQDEHADEDAQLKMVYYCNFGRGIMDFSRTEGSLFAED